MPILRIIISGVIIGLFYLLVKKAIEKGVNNAGHLSQIEQELKEIKAVLTDINSKAK